MYPFIQALVLAFLALEALLSVHAGIFVIKPSQGSVCHGGQECTIQWLDDGQSPLLAAIGVSTVGLYTGNQQLVQSIEPVDVLNSHSATFTPNPRAGPNSDAYYIAIISTTLEGNNSMPYAGFSPYFSLDEMTGSFDSPLPAATSTSSLPNPSTTTRSNFVISTITIGTLSTSLPPLPSLSATRPPPSPSSRFATSAMPSPSSSSAPPDTAAPPPLSSTSGALRQAGNLPAFIPIMGVLLIAVLFLT